METPRRDDRTLLVSLTVPRELYIPILELCHQHTSSSSGWCIRGNRVRDMLGLSLRIALPTRLRWTLAAAELFSAGRERMLTPGMCGYKVSWWRARKS
jgi:hypothetical protein